jgi:hypothetical protein
VRSMARLTIAWMCVLASAIVATTCYCVLTSKPEAALVCALGGMLLTIVAKGAVAMYTRNGAADAK